MVACASRTLPGSGCSSRGGRECRQSTRSPGRCPRWLVPCRGMARYIDGAIAERSRTLLGLLTDADLEALGISRHQRRDLLASGVLVRVHRGVNRHAAHPVSWTQAVLAATLAAGEAAVASHATAAALWRFDGMSHRTGDVVEISVPRERNPRPLDGVALHRCRRLDVADVDPGRTVPCTTAARTLIDIAPRLSRDRLEAVLDHAEQRGLVWRPHVRWRLDRLRPRAVRRTPAARPARRHGGTPARRLVAGAGGDPDHRAGRPSGSPVPGPPAVPRRRDRTRRSALGPEPPRRRAERAWVPCHPATPSGRRRAGGTVGAGRMAGDRLHLRRRHRTAGLRRCHDRRAPGADGRGCRGHRLNWAAFCVPGQPLCCPDLGGTCGRRREVLGRRCGPASAHARCVAVAGAMPCERMAG